MLHYSPGDEVTYTPKGVDAKVIQALPNNDYLVEFEDKNLIPPQMRIAGMFLVPKVVPTLYGGFNWPKDPPGHYKDDNCPKCGGLWKATDTGKTIFYDCLRCNLKKEDA